MDCHVASPSFLILATASKEQAGTLWLGFVHRAPVACKGNAVKTLMTTWQFWALASAFFAAMTAILAKVGVAQINSDFATLIRTIVILAMISAIVAASGAWQPLQTVPPRSLLFLILSGLATGASWLCYFRALKMGDAARVAPIDKLSVVMVAVFAVLFLGENLSLPNWLGVVMIAGGTILLAWRG